VLWPCQQSVSFYDTELMWSNSEKKCEIYKIQKRPPNPNSFMASSLQLEQIISAK